jgi:hypothetical protein
MMVDVQPLAVWAQQIADALQHTALTKAQRQADHGNDSQNETLWVKGMDQVAQTLTALVHALKRTQQFPHLSLLSYAQSPQGTTTYMRRGTLLSLRGLREGAPSVEFEIDASPPFRADLLPPLVRVVTTPQPSQATSLRTAHWCVGVSVHGAVVWQRLNPALQIAPEGSTEEILRSFLAVLILAD